MFKTFCLYCFTVTNHSNRSIIVHYTKRLKHLTVLSPVMAHITSKYSMIMHPKTKMTIKQKFLTKKEMINGN